MRSMPRERDIDLSEVRRVFERVVDQPAHRQRAFLDRVCGVDRTLRSNVEGLLAVDQQLRGSSDGQAEGSEARSRSEAGDKSSGSFRHFGPYRLLRRIGRGASSTVFLARRLDGPETPEVAVKILRSPKTLNRASRLRFELEKQILADLNHPHIARFIDSGTAKGRPYVVLEYVQGSPITQYCDTRCLSVSERIELTISACEAIAYAHRHLVVHRDIKPGNVLVSSGGEVKVLDFGIAKRLDGEGDPTETANRALTPRYASPEQWLGGPISTASDVYSMAVLLHELVCGIRPRDALSQEVSGGAADEPVRASDALAGLDPWLAAGIAAARGGSTATLRRSLRGDLDTILGKALRLEPGSRYPSVRHLAEDLKRFLRGEPISARPSSWSYRVGKWTRRNPLAAAGVGFSLALSLLLALAMVDRHRQVTSARDGAEQARVEAEGIAGFLVEIFAEADPRGEHGGTLTVRDLLTDAASRLHDDRQEPIAGRADLEHTLGAALAQLGAFDAAAPLLEAALDRRSNDTARADTLIELVPIALARGDYQDAVDFARRALELLHTADVNRPHTLARCHRALGRALLFKGQHETATYHARQAKRLALADGPPESTAHVESLLLLALLATDQWQLDKAREQAGQALSLLEATGSSNSLLGAEVRQIFATIARRQEHYAEALTYIDQVLEIRRRVLGPYSPGYAEGLYLKAIILWSAGDEPRSRQLLGQALQLHENLSPPNPLAQCRILRDLGGLNILLRDFGTAEQDLLKGLRLCEGREHGLLIRVELIFQLAVLERHRGALEPARARALEALSLIPEEPGDDEMAWRRHRQRIDNLLKRLGTAP